ncbi:MAG TPA: hypothetical protein VFE05_17545 [Longimicrobiaceae bacterium]|nr:hypothetical protein [Longimicrobiaceae bacterium]
MNDSTKVDACSVVRAVPNSSDFAESIEPQYRRLLTATSSPCQAAPQATASAPRFPAWSHVVQVDSVSLAVTSGMVFIHVTHGEYRHAESYSLSRAGSGGWWVREVRAWGFAQSYPTRPPDGDR